MSITAIVENDMIKLPPGVHVPDGTRVEIFLPGESATQGSGENPDTLRVFIACFKSEPEDFAAVV